MRFDIITLFPDMIMVAASHGVLGNAIRQNKVGLSVWNPRDYTEDKRRTVDDKPYGGGAGMVMKYQPLVDAVNDAKKTNHNPDCKVVYLSPQGQTITHNVLAKISHSSQLILVAGRYEGVDERFVDKVCDQEWSLGDYVISGGELAALIVIDAITRLVPGVLGDEDSAKQDSYANGLLDYPHFTRPEQGVLGNVPSVLLSGNHQAINTWRMRQSLGRTALKRPDLLAKKQLSQQHISLLQEFCDNSNKL